MPNFRWPIFRKPTVRARHLPILLILCSPPIWAGSHAPADGELIYRQGVLPSGESVRAEREPGVPVEGPEAACVNCHRRSGLGSAEGRYIIPPITGKYLFRPGNTKIEDGNLPPVSGVRSSRTSYTEATLARAIREGIDPDGRDLSYLMPRFKLSNAEMGSLVTYLKGLASNQVSGVTEDTLHFATIITPDADPIKRQGMLDVLEHIFATKNAFFRASPRMSAAKGVGFRVSRKWQLHVWELTGPPETWEHQLHERLVHEPVFAVISGMGGKTWAPVHQFCEHEAVPCLFPNVDLPVVAEKDFYTIYFSKGVLLEAELISRGLEDEKTPIGPRRVIQIFRKADIGEDAAKALSGRMIQDGIEMVNLSLKDDNPRHELVEALKNIDPSSSVILWLRPPDLALLPAEVNESQIIFMSGLMGNLENSPLPEAWRRVTRVVYPLDLPDRRKIRMNYSSAWFKIQHIPVVDERIQADTYLACGVLAEILGEMQDSFVRDYLVERIEDMLSRMTITGYYPRLGLAPGQRFASKGGFIARFADPEGGRLVAGGDWMVP